MLKKVHISKLINLIKIFIHQKSFKIKDKESSQCRLYRSHLDISDSSIDEKVAYNESWH